VPTIKLTLFAVSKDEWDTKENAYEEWHSMCSSMAKGTSWAEAMLGSEKSSHNLSHCRAS